MKNYGALYTMMVDAAFIFGFACLADQAPDSAQAGQRPAAPADGLDPPQRLLHRVQDQGGGEPGASESAGRGLMKRGLGDKRRVATPFERRRRSAARAGSRCSSRWKRIVRAVCLPCLKYFLEPGRPSPGSYPSQEPPLFLSLELKSRREQRCSGDFYLLNVACPACDLSASALNPARSSGCMTQRWPISAIKQPVSRCNLSANSSETRFVAPPSHSTTTYPSSNRTSGSAQGGVAVRVVAA